MPYPINPIDGQTAVINNVVYIYNATKKGWSRGSTGTLQPSSVSLVTTQIAITDTTTINGVSANGGFGTAGQVLTSNGSDTYWATVVETDSAVIPIQNELDEVSSLDITTLFNSTLNV